MHSAIHVLMIFQNQKGGCVWNGFNVVRKVSYVFSGKIAVVL